MEAGEQRPLRADARRNRERILKAARAAFAEEGAGAQMEPIAKRAGVGVGTLYRNFPTRRALIDAMVREWAAERAANLQHALAVADPWEAIIDNVHRSAEAMSRDAGLREVFSDLPAKQITSADEDAFREGLTALITRAHDTGVLRPEITAETYNGLMVGLAAAIAAGTDRRLAADILLAGLRAGHHAG
ncbi:TetR/AcrR family transcriptional regulator [Spirillospora sp. NBC_00431]